MRNGKYPFSIYEIILDREFEADIYIKLFDEFDKEKKEVFKLLKEKLGDSLVDIRHSNYVPIKITQTGRPNKKEMEYDYFIGPYIKRRVHTNYLHWEMANKENMDRLIGNLRATVNEINRAGDLSKYNYDAIMKNIDDLEK